MKKGLGSLRVMIPLILCLIPTSSFGESEFFSHIGLLYKKTSTKEERDFWDFNKSLEQSILNATLGMMVSSGLTFGIKYIDDQTKMSEAYSFQSGDDGRYQYWYLRGFGPSVGILNNNIFIQFSIVSILAPSLSESGYQSSRHFSYKFFNGTGTIIDLSYLIDFSGFKLGPQLSWRTFEFKKVSSTESSDRNDNDNFVKMKLEYLDPQISVFINL